MAKQRTQYTVDVEGRARLLLDVIENNNGMLTVAIRGAKAVRDDPASDAWSDLIKSQSFSVHPTSNDPSGNQLHFTGRVEGRSPSDAYHFTRAVKQTDSFAPLFARRYCTLKDPRFDPKDGTAGRVSLGLIDEVGFSLIVGVLVSRAERAFIFERLLEDQKPPLNIHQKVFGAFRLTVLWTFMSAPADPTGTNTIVQTRRPEEIANDFFREMNERDMNGYDEQEAVRWFIDACLDMKDDLLARALAEMPPARREFFHRFTQFFHDGRPDTPAFRKTLEAAQKFLRERQAALANGS